MIDRFQERGWIKFPFEEALFKWSVVANSIAQQRATDPVWQKQWMRCGETWFVGVNCLPNDGAGTLERVPLSGAAVTFAKAYSGDGPIHWDAAQASVCYRGYPQPWEGESEAALRYRRNRDAAHVDGLHREGPENRRYFKEFHQFILGIPLNDSPEQAAPFVIWEGSHKIMQASFQQALTDHPLNSWSAQDLTEIYQATRKLVFEKCRRIEVHAKPGEAYLTHRFALHGVAPWNDDLDGPEEGRMIAYFRPAKQQPDAAWLFAD